MAEFVPITDERHAKAESGERAEKADDCALTKKDPNDLGDVRAEGFYDSNLASLLYRYGNQRAHNSEGRDDNNEKEQEEHNISLEPDCFEKLTVHVDPGFGEFRWRQKVFDFVFYPFGPVRVVGLNRDAVERVFKSVKFLSDVKWNEQVFRVVNVTASLINARDR